MAKMFAIAKECFVMAKLKSRNIVASGSSQRRILLATTKREDYGKATLRFATMKKPSPWRMMTGWSNKLRFLSLSLAHFPNHINRCSLDIFLVRTLREGGSLLGFLLSLELVPFSRIRFL